LRPAAERQIVVGRTRLMKNVEKFIRRMKTDEDEMDRFVEVET
jgi:hypothetical protein